MDIIAQLTHENDNLEHQIEIQLAALQQAQRRADLLDKQRRIAEEAANLSNRICQLERGTPVMSRKRPGYFALLGINRWGLPND